MGIALASIPDIPRRLQVEGQLAHKLLYLCIFINVKVITPQDLGHGKCYRLDIPMMADMVKLIALGVTSNSLMDVANTSTVRLEANRWWTACVTFHEAL